MIQVVRVVLVIQVVGIITSARSTVLAAEVVVSFMYSRVSAITNRTSFTDSYMMTLGSWNDLDSIRNSCDVFYQYTSLTAKGTL